MADLPVALGELAALARATAAEAADLVQAMRAEAVDIAGTKSSATDVVTRADLASEALIRRRLVEARPGDGFIGEEGDDVASSTGVTWVVDPIDGTVNYLYGLPHYAVSIAAQVAGATVVGVVRAPILGLEFWATRDGGSFEGSTPLRSTSTVELPSALVATGFGYETAVRESQARAVAALLPAVRDIRRNGSCALDICAVAQGAVDAYVESGPHLWDHAAASLIATEAGACFTAEPGSGGRDLLLCAPEAVFADFAELAHRCG
ncbi:MAG: inositol monophosphatase family protein, partial [Marmoricola sp.]